MLKTNRATIRTAARLRGAVLLGATALLLAGQPAPAAAQVACGSQIGPNENVTLEADLVCPGGAPALTVVGPATLDLGRHRILCGNPNDGFFGISVLGQRAQVRNGSVESCFIGVLVSGAGSHVIENVMARDTCDSGFVVTGGADGNRLTGNVARNVGDAEVGCTVGAFGPHGFTINGSRNNLDENVALGPEEDGFHVNGEQNRLKKNAVSIPGSDGFQINATASDNHLIDNLVFGGAGCGQGFDVRGSGNRFDKNIVAGCGEGFDIDGTGNRLRLNRAIGSEEGYTVADAEHQLTRNAAFGNIAGFIVDADRSRLTRNTASGNLGGGMSVVGDDNQIRRGTALGNTLDLRDGNSNCGTNQWSRNTFQTSADPNGPNPPCIQ